MNLHFCIALCINVIILRGISSTRLLSACTYTVHVFNDSPVTLDVPVTVTAFLECADKEEEYSFIFTDDSKREIVVPGHQTARATFIFTDIPGAKVVQVDAYLLYPKRMKVASGRTIVDVHEYIPGELELTGAVVEKDGLLYVAAGQDTNMSLEIFYPQRIFNDAEFSYSWTVEESRFVSRHPYMVHQFLNTGAQWIRTRVVARIPSYDNTNMSRYKWGYFDTQIVVKNPFTNFNISGNTYLQHGQLLNLDISCSGSGPVDYCWKVLPTSENNTNLSCSHPATVVDCSFPIIYYFKDSGDFLLAIYVDNVVSAKQRNIEIHIYDVSLRPQLSTIIIPMVCTILVLLIVAGAVVAHVRRRNSYDIETADFDFMRTDESGTVVIETSWEYMRRSFLRILRVPYIYYSTEVVQKANYGTIVRQG